MQPKFDRPRLPAEVSHPLPLHIDDSVVGVHRNSVSDTVVNEHALIGIGEGHVTLTDEAGLIVAVAVLLRATA